MNIINVNKKSEIEYPCDWKYKVVVTKENSSCIESILKGIVGISFELKSAKASKDNKYYSYDVIVNVKSQVQRDLYFSKLKKDAKIVFALW